MSKMIVNSESLTAIADAIREKAETTDSLVFPNGFVDTISALGVFPEGVIEVASGTYTPTEIITTPVAVEHGMKARPNFMFIVPEPVEIDVESYGGSQLRWQVVFDQNRIDSDGSSTGGVIMWCQTGTLTGGSANPYSPSENYGANDTHCYFYSSSSIVFKVGVTYRWIAANITRT